ncbi:MAG: FAD-binding protein, partial [Deltaproteobacteria bacterium]
EVGRAAGIAVGEISASVPSVPGIRLDRALEAALTRGGIERRPGEVRGIERGKAQLGGDTLLEFDRAVLATGRFVGGGIRRGDRFVEPLCGLPIWDGRGPLDQQPIDTVVGEGPGIGAAAFRAGVRIDEHCRPFDADGRCVPWLFAAGAVIGGADHAVDGAGIGLAALTGLLAGRGAAAMG